MSAFFIAINRQRAAFDQAVAERMMRGIQHFGQDANSLIVQSHFAIAYQSQWTVPEEQGERQPLATEDGRWFVFHGRIDNREAILSRLGGAVSGDISDAALLLKYLQSFGEAELEEVIGPYVFVLFDPHKDSLIAARDGMGGRYLAYYIDDNVVLIATYELAIVTHGAVPYELNDEKAARILMNEMEARPSSTIAKVHPLNPGELLRLSDGGCEFHRFYRPDPTKRVRLADDQAYALEFKRLLTQAVRRRLRSVGAVGTMLSGGLDSVPMTIAAAQLQEANLHAFSWIFENYPELDERSYSSPICDKFNIEQVMINCDDVWPKFDNDTHVNPVFPFGIPYSEFQQETFRRAQQAGVKTLLTGIHGDLLYEYGQGIFYELVKARRWKDFAAEFKRFWRSSLPKTRWLKHYFIKPLPVVKKLNCLRNRSKPYPTDCLQDSIAALLVKQSHWLKKESRTALRPEQWQVVMDGFAGEDMAHGRYMEAKYGIERRYPYRDRDLCEFMLAIPSDQLYFNLTKRPIIKRAFAAELSPELLARNDKTDFSAIIEAGIEKDNKNLKWFASSSPNWSHFVKECYFEHNSTEKQQVNVIQWRCGYYEYWKSVCYNPVHCELGQINEKTQDDE